MVRLPELKDWRSLQPGEREETGGGRGEAERGREGGGRRVRISLFHSFFFFINPSAEKQLYFYFWWANNWPLGRLWVYPLEVWVYTDQVCSAGKDEEEPSILIEKGRDGSMDLSFRI